jgi:hypothetical protein
LAVILENLAVHLAAASELKPFKGSPFVALSMIFWRKDQGTALAIMPLSPIPIAAKEKSAKEKSAKEKSAKQKSEAAFYFSYLQVRP